MKDGTVLIICLIAVFLVLAVIAALLARTANAFPYQRARLLSAAEEAFFTALQSAVGPDFLVFTKIRLADIVEVKKGLEAKTWRRAFNRIQSKHIDFAIVKSGTVEIVWAVELDDPSHNRADRQRRDSFVDNALNAAGIEIRHFRTRKSYDPKEIAAVLSAPGLGESLNIQS